MIPKLYEQLERIADLRAQIYWTFCQELEPETEKIRNFNY